MAKGKKQAESPAVEMAQGSVPQSAPQVGGPAVSMPSEGETPTSPAPAISVPTIDDVIPVLSAEFDVDEATIRGHIQKFLNDGFSLVGAVARFRSENRNRIKQKGIEYEGRVIGLEAPRMMDLGEGRASLVAAVTFMTIEAGVPTVRRATFWGDDRVNEMRNAIVFDGCYRFTAVKKANGELSRLKDLARIGDTLPGIEDLPKLGVSYAELKDVEQYVGSSDIFRGWVGRLIKDKDTGKVIGFEMGDVNAGPVTVWVGGRYNQVQALEDAAQTLTEGSEVIVYGQVRHPADKDVRIYASGVFNVSARRQSP